VVLINVQAVALEFLGPGQVVRVVLMVVQQVLGEWLALGRS
jgi:hypothetical protein